MTAKHIGSFILLLLLVVIRPACGENQTNRDDVKAEIIVIQEQVVDLTNPLEPLFNKQFLKMRKSMSASTARKIVGLIEKGDLTPTQSDIAVLLLSNLDQQIYWHVTQELLTTNTDNEALDTLLIPPLPYGPGYANSYKYEFYYKKLLALKAIRQWGCAVKSDLDLVLSGEASCIYADYLKHPDKYGYRSPDQYMGNQ